MTHFRFLLGIGLLSFCGCEALWGGFYKDHDMALASDLGTLADAAVTGCQANADCPSGLCVDVQLGPYSPGVCVPADAVLYVDWDNCSVGTKSGKLGNPFCEVQDAIKTIQPLDQSLHIFQVKSSTTHQYQGITIGYGNVALLGPWADPKLKGTPWDQTPAAILLGSNDPAHPAGLYIRVESDKGPVTAVVDGFSILATTTGLGVNIENYGPGEKLTLRRSTVSGSAGYGVYVSNPGPATLTMDRCKVTGNQKVGLLLSSQTTQFTITNSLFTYNGMGGGYPGVSLDGPPDGVFDSNTVTYNGATGAAGGIDCKASQSISNSIVLKNVHVNGSQFLSSCQLHNTVVDDLDEKIPNGTKCNLGVTSESLLTTQMSACAIDAAPVNADRGLDYFGNRRPQGSLSDIGFHELVKP